VALLNYLFVALLLITTGSAFAQGLPSAQSLEMRATDFICGPVPPQAHVTDLTTGKGIRIIGINLADDKIPACGGSTPSTPVVIGPAPLATPIPQLVRIISDQGSCSGALIRNNAVITAGHCVLPPGANGYVTNLKVYPGYQNGPNNSFGGARKGLQVLTFAGWTAAKNYAHDIAVILMDGSLEPMYAPLGLQVFNQNSCNYASKLYVRPHYNPDVSNNQVQAIAEGWTIGCKEGTLMSGLPAGHGSSGSVMYDRYARSIIGVHSAFDNIASYDAVLTKAKICAIWNFFDESEGLNCKASE